MKLLMVNLLLLAVAAAGVYLGVKAWRSQSPAGAPLAPTGVLPDDMGKVVVLRDPTTLTLRQGTIYQMELAPSAPNLHAMGFSNVVLFGTSAALPAKWPSLMKVGPTWGQGTWSQPTRALPRPPGIVQIWWHIA